MNMLDMILNAQDGRMVDQLGQQYGLGSSDAKNAITQLLPSLAKGIQNNASKQGRSGLSNYCHAKRESSTIY